MSHLTAVSERSSPIFVVGVPRSGTTLLAAYLGSHSRLICGTETDFFHFLAKVDEQSLLARDDWPHNAVDFVFRQVPGKNRQSVPEEYGLNKADILSFLERREPSIRAILSAVTEQYMQKMGKHRWVEKTPNHILHLKEIRRCFPDAAIICIVRDPRDVALSIIKTPWSWAPRTLIGALAMWRYLDDCSAGFFASDMNAYTIKYEELLSDPHMVLNHLCEFLGERFEDSMLQKDQSYEQVNRLNEPWKKKVAEIPDVSRMGVWDRELDSHTKTICISLIGDKLLKYGYSCENNSMRWGVVFPRDAYLRYPMLSDWLLAQGVRIWNCDDIERPALLAIVGDPDRDNWLGHNRYRRVINFSSILSNVLGKRLRGTPVYWIVQENSISGGILNRVAAKFLTRLGVRVPADAAEQPDLSWRINLTNYPKLGSPEEAANGFDAEKKRGLHEGNST